ncbi:Fic family protein [Herbidospora sp. RD11066]
MLFQVPELTDDDHRVLAEIDEFRRRLRFQLAEPHHWDRPLRRSLTARAIVGSNTIEGYTVSLDTAQAVVAGIEPSGESGEAALDAVRGYHDALTYVQQSASFEVFAYEEMLLSALHFMMIRNVPGKWPGRYRSGGILVTGGPGRPPAYVGPDAEEVPGLMRELVDWLTSGDLDAPVFVRAALAHLNLVSIHPWRDGNGRMSRCLHTLVLARDRVLAPEFSSIEEWLGLSALNTAEYYAALATTGRTYQPDHDTHEWVRFCLRVHHIQAQIVDRRVVATARTWGAITELAESRGLHERTITALYSATTGGLRRGTYEKDEGLTRDQALRDLNLLVRLGLLEPVGQGNLRSYTAAAELKALSEEISHAVTGSPLREPYQ